METDRDNISDRVASFAYYLDTAKDNLVHTVSAQETTLVLNTEKTKPHAIKPPLNANVVSHSKRMSKDTLPSVRVDSFSYNRNLTGENFVFNIPQPIKDPTTAFTFFQENPKKDGEIGVFGADKYFSMKLEYQTGQKPHERPVDLIGIESRIKPRTPSLRSEASSWNSQSALLPSIHINGPQTKPKKAARRRIFAGLGCQGPCFDKKDVHVNDLIFIPPINPSHATEIDELTVKKKLNVSDIEESRTSIEVFGSSETIKSKGSSDVAASMERKLSMLTWDAIPVKKGQNFQTTTTVNSTVCDDMASDASSDLFEIENISGTLYPMLTSAAETDNLSSCMSPAYAPSEASIQWSVVTASAADYSSVLSEFNDESAMVVGDAMNNGNNRKLKPRNAGEKEVQKSKLSSGLLGCKNQKAVDVAENVCCNKGRVKDKDTLQLPSSYTKIH